MGGIEEFGLDTVELFLKPTFIQNDAEHRRPSAHG